MPRSLALLWILTGTLALAEKPAGDPPPWKTDRTVDGMTLSTRPVKDSKFEEVRVTTVSDVPLVDVCDAVWGKNAKAEGKIKKRVVIRESETDRWTYEQIKVPLAKDRDTIIYVQKVSGAETGRCEITFETRTDPDYPVRSDHVRIPAMHGRWIIETTTEGKTAIDYTVYSEPGGWVPAMFARGGQRDAVLESMKMILSRADKLEKSDPPQVVPGPPAPSTTGGTADRASVEPEK